MFLTYRYYCLDLVGNLRGAKWIQAESDDDAVALIDAKHDHALCEIWQGNRLVVA